MSSVKRSGSRRGNRPNVVSVDHEMRSRSADRQPMGSPTRPRRSASATERAPRRFAAVAVATVVVAASLVTATAASAQAEDPDPKTAALEQLAAANDKLAELDARRAEVERVIAAAEARGLELAADIAERTDEIEELSAEITDQERRVGRLSTSIARTTLEVKLLKEAIRQRAIESFVAGPARPGDAFLDAEGFDEAALKRDFLLFLNRSDAELADRMETLEGRLVHRKRTATDLKDRLSDDRDQQRRALGELVADTAELDEVKAVLETRKAELESLIADAQSDVDAAEEALAEVLRMLAEEKAALDAIGRSGSGLTLDGRPTCTTEGIVVACDIAPNVARMIVAARQDDVVLTGGGWRNTAWQMVLRAAHCDGDVFGRPASACSPPTARPGSSQHEFGLAIDFDDCSTRSTDCYQWLAENAERFGFYNLPSEPWHWSTTGN